MKGFWTCQRVSGGEKCGHRNPNRKQLCERCRKPRPPRRQPAHRKALELPYEAFVQANGGDWCGICGKEGSVTRKLDRDHDQAFGFRLRPSSLSALFSPSMGRARRAIGIVRVSQVRGRAGESFASPTEQADRIRADCSREGLKLLRVVEELDVSGGKDLDDRPGLGPAVRAIEAGEAEVIVGAYFDRLFRSLKAQGEAVERVERAGGQVRAVDVGSRQRRERGPVAVGDADGHGLGVFPPVDGGADRDAQAAAIRRGVAPYGRVPAGYRKRADGVFEPDPEKAPVVAEAFAMRARGETVDAVWRHLRAGGITITYGGAYALLQSRAVLGEIHFGKHTPNLEAHEPIVDRGTWDAVQAVRVPSGGRRRANAPRPARHPPVRDVRLQDGGSTATGSTSAGGGGGRKYAIYRCGNKDCPRQMT
jgi:hypothetical protein